MNDVKILTQEGYNFLWVNNYLWMWDVPAEQEAQREMATQAYGRVLIAGYGLGIAQRYLKQNPRVTKIITVEKYPEVIHECRRVYKEIYGTIIIADFFTYSTTEKYDCILGDIWEDILPQNLDCYMKFKKKAQALLKPGGKIIAWGLDYFEYLINKGYS